MTSALNQEPTNKSTEIPCRPATFIEAVEAIMRCLTKECRLRHLAYFESRQGEQFASRVESEVRRRFKEKK